MKIYNIQEMWRGWMVGNFEPSVYKTELFEVGIIEHKKQEKWDKHYHKISTEINYLISGKMKICDKIINAGEIFVLEPFEIADPEFFEDCKIVVIKTPSVIGDKYKVL